MNEPQRRKQVQKTFRLAVCGTLCVVWSGCAGKYVSDLTPDHPGHPAARQATLAPPSTTLQVTDPVTPPADGAMMHSATQGKRDSEAKEMYSCPMHPDVRSPKPGRCPKCQMVLTQKQTMKMQKEADK